MVDKHTILRTSFINIGISKPVQRVHKTLACNIQFLDYSNMSEEEQSQKIEQLLESERKTGYDFKSALLNIYKLIKISDRKYKFSWIHHHILMDGWSLPILLREFFSFYEAFCNNQKIAIGDDVDKYEEFIDYLSQKDMKKAENFWRYYLEGFTTPTDISMGRITKKDNESGDYKKKALIVDAEVTRKLVTFAKQNKLTTNTLVQSAWALLLSRYSGRNDIVFGMTVSGRPANLLE